MTIIKTWQAQRQKSWAQDRWGTLICRSVWDETPDVRTFLLVPADGSRIAHAPGQFMTFKIRNGEGAFIERCYTIASSAARSGSIEITVKNIKAGAVSPLLHRQLVVGQSIEAFGPSGRFGPLEDMDTRYALIAAGSGVTPILSMLRTAADHGINLDAAFIHVARRHEDAIASDELPMLMRRLPGLAANIIPTQAAGGSRLTPDGLRRIIPDLAERIVLCCGPASFMQMVAETARQAGVQAENYFEESFDFSSGLTMDTAVQDAPVRRISFAKSGISFDCAEGTTLLSAAKQAGVPVPFSCARGECGTCKVFKHSGEVVMLNQGGIRQREIDRGFILPCVSRPLTDIVLDR